MIRISLENVPKGSQHDHAHRLLAEMLKDCGIEYGEDTEIVYGKYGKPSLAEHPEIHYNISHADGIAVCVICEDECGADAEKVRKYRPNVVKRAFSESEKALMESAPEAERDLLFFRIWTLKEAYVKMLGIGVSYPLEKAEFSFCGDEISSNVKGCRFTQYRLKNDSFVVSVCEKI